MAAQVSQSQILAKLKTKSKGGWKKARQVTPSARSTGGLPPGLKGAIAVCKEYKLAQTTKGDPFFSLTGIVASPPELEGKRATAMWFINDSQYATIQDNLDQLANDIGLIYQGEMPEDEAGILEVMKELCENEVAFLFNTSRPKSADKNPNVVIQGLAEGYEGGGEGAEGGDETTEEVTEEVTEEPADETAEYTPQDGDEYYYSFTPKGKKKKEKHYGKLSDVDAEKGTCTFSTTDMKPNVKFKGVTFDKLEA
jgi:hypothetical protein